MTERYDHRAPEARQADADEDTIDQPLQSGAAELRREAEDAVEEGDLENDPSGPPKPDDPG